MRTSVEDFILVQRVNKFPVLDGEGRGRIFISYTQILDIRPGSEVNEPNSHYINLKFNCDIILPSPVLKEFSTKLFVSIFNLLYETQNIIPDILMKT